MADAPTRYEIRRDPYPEKAFGSLRRVLEAASRRADCNRADLTVLGKDPYRLDTPAGHRDGQWVAAQVLRAFGPLRRFHWRGLHYAVVVAGDIVKPNGEIYRNTDDDWLWLSEHAARPARWLGYVPFDRIIDNRNADRVIHRRAKVTPWTYLSMRLEVEIPDVSTIDPYPGIADFEGRQPYSLAIYGEKASLEDVLLPIAQRYDADLYLQSGEISDTRLWQMAKDAADDGRSLAVFVLADCDPAGRQMAVSIGRKLQALRDLLFPKLEFEIVPAALEVEQVRDLGLPSTPLKESEKRADRWREEFGVEQTEIDALATLRPRDLEAIVHAAIEPYFDLTLKRRVDAAYSEWREAAQEAVDEQIDSDALDAVRERTEEKLEEFEAEVDQTNAQLQALGDGISLPKAVVPEPELDEGKLGRQAPLISTAWQSWTEATRALKARKAYGSDGE
jgi:hypothetical protein